MAQTADEDQATHNLSQRGWANVGSIMPKIKGAVSERMSKTTTNIDLSTSENWLLRPELVELCRNAIAERLEPKHLSYPRGFSGDPDLLDAFCGILNTYFRPHTPVESSHLAVAPGANAAIDALLYNICEAGDGAIIPGPYWNGFDFAVSVRSQVTPVLASVSSLDSVFDEDSFVASLEEAHRTSDRPIKALLLTNPHNPLSLCYSKSLLQACAQFCERHDMHFICDEVYAFSVFQSPDIPDAQTFVSALSLDLKSLGVDPSRVHVVWSMSKDFGQSGMRMGLSITQNNPEMAVGCALAAQMQISNLTSIFATALLTAPNLDDLIKLNAERLANAYSKLTGFFKEFEIPYLPCNAGLYVFAQIAPSAQTWEDESLVVGKLKDAGVLVSSGRAYHGPEKHKGWARIGFAVDPKDLDEALKRMRAVFVVLQPQKTGSDSINAGNAKKRQASILEDKTISSEQGPVKRAKVH